MDQFIKQLRDYEEQSSEQLWDRLEDRLDLQQATRSKIRYKLFAGVSAAVVLVLLAIFFLPSNDASADGLFVSIGNDKAQIIEELDINKATDDIYSVRNRRMVNYAYQKLGVDTSF